MEAPGSVACEERGVEGEFAHFGKRDIADRGLILHGKRVALKRSYRRPRNLVPKNGHYDLQHGAPPVQRRT